MTVPKRRVTISDIARRLDCSPATVSRAINGQSGVGEEMRAQIMEECERVGFVINRSASYLRRQKYNSIGVVVPTLDNAAYIKMINAVEAVVVRHGYQILYTQHHFDVESEYEQTRMLLARGVDGVILVGYSHSKKLDQLIVESGVPFLNTYSYHPHSAVPCVGYDNRQAMYDSADLLINYGHTEIAYISGVMKDNDRVQERHLGFTQRLAEAGLELRQEHFLESRYTIQDGYVAMKRLIDSGAPFTAVATGSDVLAFGVLSACREYGVRVPEDKSVIGFDNQHFAEHLTPPLTTINTPAEQMGEIAAQMLVDRLERDLPMKSVKLQASVVVRKSVARRLA